MAEISAIEPMHERVDEKPTARRMRDSRTPGVQVEADRFVVLHSRLGRRLEKLPKLDPDDDKEPQKWFSPEAFERGMIITSDDIPEIPGMDNVERLIHNGAIGRLDHPEAANAIEGLRFRLEQEAKVAQGR